MNQESNFLNQWFHLRYQEDLSEFDDGLSLSNLYALVGAGRLLGSVLLLAAVMLHRHCGTAVWPGCISSPLCWLAQE